MRTIVSAIHPYRYADDYTEIHLKVWFEEIGGPFDFVASPLDPERHGKELWIRAMAGEYGKIEVIPIENRVRQFATPAPMRMLENHAKS